MLAHPAARVARAWLNDPEAQAAIRSEPGSPNYFQARLASLRAFALLEDQIDVQVRTLTGCVPANTRRPCSERASEQIYHAQRVLRHYVSFFGFVEQWSLSMRLLEATMRFGFGAPWYVNSKNLNF